MTSAAVEGSNNDLSLLDLSELPGKVAQVQSELQRLDDAIQQAKLHARQAELASQRTAESQELLQDQLRQDIKAVHTLQVQQEALLAVKCSRDCRLKPVDKQTLIKVTGAVLQIQLKIIVQYRSFQWSCRSNASQHSSNSGM